MVNIVGNIDGISIFEDSLIEDNKIIKGRKQGGTHVYYCKSKNLTTNI